MLIGCCLIAAAAGACEEPRGEVLLFHAASLSRVLSGVEQALERESPDLDLRLEPSGSQTAARKIAELNRPGDLVLSADAGVIERILIPAHAEWNLIFATNEIVLAHGEHSPFTERIDSKNWPALLLEPGVRLGRVNEHTAPIGFMTLQAWKLAQGGRDAGPDRTDLAARLAARVRPEHLTPDIAELATLLEARAIDYAVLFRNVAEEHNLKLPPLLPEHNLSRPELDAQYARVSVPVRMHSREASVEVPGAAIRYSLTIPRSAPHPARAERVAAFLLGAKGRALLERSGFRPLVPPQCARADRLPAVLRALVEPARGAP